MRRMTKGIVTQLQSTRVDLGDLGSMVGLHDGIPVLVIATKSNFLRLIPIPSRHVAQLCVAFDLDLFRESARVVLSEIRRRDLQMVHSTGFCPLKDCCVWEGYFAFDASESVESLMNWVRSQSGVLDVEVQYLEI